MWCFQGLRYTLIILYFYFICFTCMYIYHMHAVPTEARRGQESKIPQELVYPSRRCWELNSGPPWEQQVLLLMAEPSFQGTVTDFCYNFLGQRRKMHVLVDEIENCSNPLWAHGTFVLNTARDGKSQGSLVYWALKSKYGPRLPFVILSFAILGF